MSEPESTATQGAGRRLLRDLVKFVAPRNLRLSADRIEIDLARDWMKMLAGLAGLGPCLSVTRNAAAILGTLAPYPVVKTCEPGLRARSLCGRLDIELPPWEQARAVAEERMNGIAHYIDFCDGAGDILHRVNLCACSDPEAYLDWVVCHQAGRTPSSPAVSLPFAASRWRTVQQRHWFDYEEITELSPTVLAAVFDAARREQVLLSCLVGNHSVVQAADFLPVSIRRSGHWTFVSDDSVGLHFDPGNLSSVIVHRPNSDAAPFLKAFDDHGNLSLAIGPAALRSCDEWQAFLENSTQSHAS